MNDEDSLLIAAEALEPQLFAVIDGGKFDDAEAALASAGLSGRPLYLEGADPGVRAAAGHLVALTDRRDLRAVIALAKPREALVIWSWPSGFMALYRHLRTINLVEIPNEARARAVQHGEDVSDMPEYEAVLFRHWDPTVLASLLPLLDEPQRARFLGPAAGLAFHSTPHGGLQSPSRSSDAGSMSQSGMLRFTSAQFQQLDVLRQAAVYREVADDLLLAWPDHIAPMGDAELIEFVKQTHRTAETFGLTTSHSLTYLCLITLMITPSTDFSLALRASLASPEFGMNPDDRMERFYDELLDQLIAQDHA